MTVGGRRPSGGGGTYLSAQGTTPGVYPATPPWTLGRKVGSHPTTPPWTFAGNVGGGGGGGGGGALGTHGGGGGGTTLRPCNQGAPFGPCVGGDLRGTWGHSPRAWEAGQ